MKYRGREIDVIGLWENYVDFPPNVRVDGMYLPKVKCPNPEHETDKRHFQINAQDGLVHCFAYCGISGTFTRAIAMIEEGDDGRDAQRRAKRTILKYATGRAKGVARIRKRVRPEEQPIPTGISLEYETFIPQYGRKYLDERGISSDSIARWRIGWEPDSRRIVIPADDLNGQTRFLVKRSTRERDQPKYLYYPEKERQSWPWGKTDLLFGACHIDLGMIRSLGIILVEGSIDTINVHQHGLPIAGGILGTGISLRQCEIVSRLRPRRVYLAFDKDTAGITNIQLASKRLHEFPLFVCRYQKGISDPGQLDQKGVDRLLDRAIPISSFYRKYPNVRPARRKEAIVG